MARGQVTRQWKYFAEVCRIKCLLESGMIGYFTQFLEYKNIHNILIRDNCVE